VQAGNTGLVKRVASVVAHGILSSLKIARVVLAMLAAIGLTAAAIGGAIGLATVVGVTLFGLNFFSGGALLTYVLRRKDQQQIQDLRGQVEALQNRVRSNEEDPVVLGRANAQLGESVHYPHAHDANLAGAAGGDDDN
jgi:hypothetical protein